MATRKNVIALSAAEKSAIINAVLQLSAAGGYGKYVAWHSQAMDLMSAHMGPAFCPWHRQFVLLFERDLRNIVGDPNWALPYWDWAADSALPDPTAAPVWGNDFAGGNGDPNNNNLVATGPFAFGPANPNSWRAVDGNGNPLGGLQRAFGADPQGNTLPAVADVSALVTADPSVQPYDSAPWDMTNHSSFRNTLEGFNDPNQIPQLHNRVHVWAGGHMAQVPLAPNDPVFFVHHCNIDRIWASWQARYFPPPADPAQGYAPITGGPHFHNIDDPMMPLPGNPTPRSVLSIAALGYQYDALVPIP